MGTAKKKTPLFGEKIRTSRDLIRIGSDSKESRDVCKLASKSGYVRWTYVSVCTFAYVFGWAPLGAIRIRLRIRPSWLRMDGLKAQLNHGPPFASAFGDTDGVV